MSVPGQCPCQCTCEITQGAISHAHGQHTDGDSPAFLTYISGAHVQHPFVLVSTLQSLYEWAISQLNNCYYSGAYPHYPLITKAFSRKSFHTRGRALEGALDSQHGQHKVSVFCMNFTLGLINLAQLIFLFQAHH